MKKQSKNTYELNTRAMTRSNGNDTHVNELYTNAQIQRGNATIDHAAVSAYGCILLSHANKYFIGIINNLPLDTDIKTKI